MKVNNKKNALYMGLSEIRTRENSTDLYHFPLYFYFFDSTDEMFAEKERVPNLNMEIVEKITQQLGLQFNAEKFSFN